MQHGVHTSTLRIKTNSTFVPCLASKHINSLLIALLTMALSFPAVCDGGILVALTITGVEHAGASGVVYRLRVHKEPTAYRCSLALRSPGSSLSELLAHSILLRTAAGIERALTHCDSSADTEHSVRWTKYRSARN